MPRVLPEVTATNAVKMAGMTSALALVLGGVVSLANYDQRVTLDVDGAVLDVRTTAETVGELLDDHDVKLADEDRISVPVAQALTPDTLIEVRSAKPVTLVVDGEVSQNTVYTTTVGETLEQLKVTPKEGAHLSAPRTAAVTNRGMSLIVSNPKKVTVQADGKKHTVVTAEPTVADVFDELGLRLKDLDEAKPGLGSYVKPGQSLKLTRIVHETRTETLDVKFPVNVSDDSSMFAGETTVVKAGEAGADKAKVKLILADGKVRERVVVSRSSIRPPIAQVEKRGTKKRPDDSVWDRLAKCESGGNWATNTGNGYYGGVQFSASTWRSVGGSGLPHQHSREEQIKRGKILQARAGWGQWPSCTRKLGLR
ncbi:MAG: DUF348 domain-containing protein [Actinomycetales bacterium]|nr:DUF348 domain-containing protein [Actinomycetales bacterium]